METNGPSRLAPNLLPSGKLGWLPQKRTFEPRTHDRRAIAQDCEPFVGNPSQKQTGAARPVRHGRCQTRKRAAKRLAIRFDRFGW